MEYRIDKQGLMDRIIGWDGFLKRGIHLIACGGTALTLLGIKASTKDIDLIVPNVDEYEYLIATLKQLGYKSITGSGWSREDGFIFDLFRGSGVDIEDCLMLLKSKKKEVDLEHLEKRFKETASFDISEDRVNK
ncbi:MAG: hypothetical protein Q8O30_12705, partial [Candidatus Omnitrophota bacterium]|nr:hypothetical protein [Candidatus Omnitrophota bacterium]